MSMSGGRRVCSLLVIILLCLPICARAEAIGGHDSTLIHVSYGISITALIGTIVFLLLYRKHKLNDQKILLEQQHKSELLRLAEMDDLTGIYNKKKLFREVDKLIHDCSDLRFVLIRLDIARFQLYNTYLGSQEGDKLLKHIANVIRHYAESTPYCLYGHIGVDVFAIVRPFTGETSAVETVRVLKSRIRNYDVQYDINPCFGLFVIDDIRLPVSTMLDCAALAARTVKKDYLTSYAFYTERLSDAMLREQELINDMPAALSEHQFILAIQPKYDLKTSVPVGGEALVRWNHPQKGLLQPGAFLSVFEKNGLITTLDYYVWDAACQLLRRWIDEGKNPRPISVNVSRVDLYHPQIVAFIRELVQKYDLPPAMLELEVTESAYTDNPEMMQQLIAELRENGFTVLMDDFGSGYSSLNMLKNIAVDILKIDMRFLSESTVPGRGQNILVSVARMAKWLGLPVIVEGVENADQADFLHSIGCEYAQGYYYARPISPEDYISLEWLDGDLATRRAPLLSIDDLWAADPAMETEFNDSLHAVSIYEFDAETREAECLRVNKAYCELFGYEDAAQTMQTAMTAQQQDYRVQVREAFYAVATTGKAGEYELMRHTLSGQIKWVRATIRPLSTVGAKSLLICSMADITTQVEIRQALPQSEQTRVKPRNAMLIVDDQSINRDMLRRIFDATFDVLEAANGSEALKVLEQNPGRVDIILLDMVMPVMDGKAFLQMKKTRHDIEKIPVIIITANSSVEQQINMLAIGANDYIVKPIVPDMVIRRVNSVLETSNRFRALLREYRQALEQSKTDPLTHVLNRAAIEEAVTETLKRDVTDTHALVMIDIDDYKNINDTYGHGDGDLVLTAFGNKLVDYFRSGDLIARMGGDEFCVLMQKIRADDEVLAKCAELCKIVAATPIGEGNIRITCSIGIAVSAPESTFRQLYRDADTALYRSKALGKNRATLFSA